MNNVTRDGSDDSVSHVSDIYAKEYNESCGVKELCK